MINDFKVVLQPDRMVRIETAFDNMDSSVELLALTSDLDAQEETIMQREPCCIVDAIVCQFYIALQLWGV